MGVDDGWRDALQVVDASADLVVARSSSAFELGAETILFEGRAPSRAGYYVRRFLALPDLFLPLDRPEPVRYALRSWAVPTRRWKRLRNRLLGPALRSGLVGPIVTLAARDPGPPFLVARAAELGVPADAGWFLTFGEADVLSRGVFHLFAPEAEAPSWVLKFSRVPGYAAPFEADERGLALAAAAGPLVAEHAPRFLGRFEEAGLHASLETAAVGMRLLHFLAGPGSRGEKVAAIERVAAWLVEIARETAAAAQELEPELPLVSPVLQHGNLGSWNVIVRDDRFVAVDWEHARHGFPLWDLVYFLADALAQLDGRGQPAAREEHFAELFRGELDSSGILFRWLREATGATSVPADDVGPLVTACWLADAVPNPVRAAAAERIEPGSRPARTQAQRLAERWLSDPFLGPGWSSWRG